MQTMRRRLIGILLLAVGAGLVWIAAPALSMHRYMPGAVDFEQHLPALRVAAQRPPEARLARPRAKAGKGPVSFRSGVITAPERFDLVGLARELRPLEIRARDDGGAWSDWIVAEDGNPVYFGGADQLQVRARGWRPQGTLHYVNVSGTTSTSEGLLTKAREAINSAFISVGNTLTPAAEATPTRPDVITRAQWGATAAKGGCPPRAKPSYGMVKAAVVHHTVTANDYTEEEAPSIVLGICRFHRNANGWNDIGYDALVDRFGNLYVGRAGGLRKAVVGAHAQGFNAQTTGVASIGTHTSTPITPATRRALVDYLAWKLSVHGLTATGKTTMTSAGGEFSRYPSGKHIRTNKIIGHRVVGLTACPGDALFEQIPHLRRLVQRKIDAGGGIEPPPDDGGGILPPPVPKR